MKSLSLPGEMSIGVSAPNMSTNPQNAGFKERVTTAFDKLLPFCRTISCQSRYLDRKILDWAPADCRRAVDIGCGYGEFTYKLAARCEQAIGYDLSPSMLTEARAGLRSGDKHQPEFRQADCDVIPETFEDVDFVVCIRSIHYLDIEKFLRRISSTASPGCRLAIVGVSRKYCRHPLGNLVLEMLFYLLHPWRVIKFLCDFGWRTFLHTHRSKFLMDRNPLWRKYIDSLIFEGMLLPFPKYNELYRRLLPGCVIERISVREFVVTWQKP